MTTDQEDDQVDILQLRQLQSLQANLEAVPFSSYHRWFVHKQRPLNRTLYNCNNLCNQPPPPFQSAISQDGGLMLAQIPAPTIMAHTTAIPSPHQDNQCLGPPPLDSFTYRCPDVDNQGPHPTQDTMPPHATLVNLNFPHR